MAKKKALASLVPAERIEQSILLIRGQKVLTDSDLAELYGVETKALVRAVKRNIGRFPEDFMFQLTTDEWTALRSHFGTLNMKRQIGTSSSASLPPASPSQVVTRSWGGRRTLPYVFTEQGVAMLSSVLRSDRAIAVNVEIMRAFVRLRQILASHADLARRLDDLEKKYDAKFRAVFDAIRQLMAPPPAGPRRPIGFQASQKNE